MKTFHVVFFLISVFVTVILARNDITIVRKCCRKGEHLTADTFDCIPRPGMQKFEVLEEKFFNLKEFESNYWMPKKILDLNVALVKYGHDLLQRDFINSFENNRNSSLFDSKDKELSVRCVNNAAQEDTISKNKICFDFPSNGRNFAGRVLQTLNNVITHTDKHGPVRKWADCCVSRFYSNGFKERVPPGNSDVPYALPERRPLNGVSEDTFPRGREGWIALPAEDSLQWDLNKSEVVIEVASAEHEELGVNITTEHFCFDTINERASTSKVLLARVCPRSDGRCFSKCCSIGYVLNSVGECAKYEMNYGTIKSLIYHFFTHRTNGYIPVIDFSGTWHSGSLCSNAGTTVCADLSPTDNKLESALGVCFPSSPLEALLRPLSTTAAVLLVGALVSALARGETRSSMHGRALICHAASLLIASALQAVGVLQAFGYPCQEVFAYVTYFFLVSSGMWLNVVSINMAIGFGRVPIPRGASPGGWRRFALYACYAWLVASALTALAVVGHRAQEHWHRQRFITPSFLETRTRLARGVYVDEIIAGDFGRRRMLLGTLLFFYLPMVLLTLTNAVCLAFTTFKIRQLSRNASKVDLSRTHVSNAERCVPPGLQNAVLYVKLLLTAGVVDFVAAGATGAVWTTWTSSPFDSDACSSVAGCLHSEEPTLKGLNWMHNTRVAWAVAASSVDVLRAAAVWWLCCGRWCGADVVGCWLIDGADTWLRERSSWWRKRCAGRPLHSARNVDDGLPRYKRASTQASLAPSVLSQAQNIAHANYQQEDFNEEQYAKITAPQQVEQNANADNQGQIIILTDDRVKIRVEGLPKAEDSREDKSDTIQVQVPPKMENSVQI